ncbi:MAG: 5-(carboxyamino)imidazole ribonucleotide mutase [Acidobacteriota bacterium]
MTRASNRPRVGIIMGSRSDDEHLALTREMLTELQIPFESRVLSAHRTPEETAEYARTAEGRGIEVIIAAAGGAAHLAGVIASSTLLPVLGVPIPSTSLDGIDSLLSIVQMPKGVPVGTLAIGKPGAANAALLAAEILALNDPALRDRLRAWRAARRDELLREPVP